MADALNADFARRVVVDTSALEWQPSPSPTVWRKRLELFGPAESGAVTSVVRYDPGATFHRHGHPDGEEILVLEGVFSDDRGDHPAGTFLLNPEGFSHAPFSRCGCVLFVKLRQYAGTRPTVTVDTRSAAWHDVDGARGLEHLELYREAAFPETILLERMTPGAEAQHTHPGGEEIFVISGAFEDEEGVYREGTWLRLPAGSTHAPRSAGGCLLYVKRGHLARVSVGLPPERAAR